MKTQYDGKVVKLTSTKYADRDCWGGCCGNILGVITGGIGRWIDVKWYNNRHNSYMIEDLSFVDREKIELKEFKV